MIKELLIYFFTIEQMDFVLFIPALALSFFAGLISLVKGVGRWT